MEDNEFEEVTIISHTEHARREVEWTVEQVKSMTDRVGLEIVEGGIEGARALEGSACDPRLAPGLRELEKLKQDHFGEGEGRIPFCRDIYFISRVAGESGQYLLGAEGGVILANGSETKLVIQDKRPIVLTYWGNYLLVFLRGGEQVIAYDLPQLQEPKKVGLRTLVHLNTKVMTTEKYVYYVHRAGGLCRLDRHLDYDEVDEIEGVLDFFVCPKTETITTLQESSEESTIILKSNNNQVMIGPDSGGRYILKKMYSDHFLVGETNGGSRTSLTLVDAITLTVADKIDKTPDPTKQISSSTSIRLLAPRQGINCFLAVMRHSLELFCEYRLKLYHLKTLETTKPLGELAHQTGELWMVSTKVPPILSVRVDFSKCPALQL